MEGRYGKGHQEWTHKDRVGAEKLLWLALWGWETGRMDERVSSDLQPQALCLAVFSLSLPTQSPRDLSRLGSCFTTPAGSRQGVLTTLWFQLLVS